MKKILKVVMIKSCLQLKVWVKVTVKKELIKII